MYLAYRPELSKTLSVAERLCCVALDTRSEKEEEHRRYKCIYYADTHTTL